MNQESVSLERLKGKIIIRDDFYDSMCLIPEKSIKSLHVSYDDKEDILYFKDLSGKHDGSIIELGCGINLELDEPGNVTGIRIYKASHLLEPVIEKILKQPKDVIT